MPPKKVIDERMRPRIYQNSTFRWSRQDKDGTWKRKQYTATFYLTDMDMEHSITLEQKAEAYWNYKQQKLEEESGKISKGFSNEMVGEITEKPSMRQKRQLKMKNYVFKLGEGLEQEWDTKTGRCVFDYLIYTYKDIKGFKKKMNYDFLNGLFRSDEVDDERNPLEQGVSIEQLRKFCDEFDINMYAFDEDEKAIEIYKSSNNKGKDYPLMFKMFNDHFYPIDDAVLRKSIASSTYNSNNHISSVNIKYPTKEETSKKKKGKKGKKSKKEANKYEATEEDFEKEDEETETIYNIISPQKPMKVEARNRFALMNIFKREEIPFPLIPSKLSIRNGSIHHLILGNDMLRTTPDCEISKYLIENYIGKTKYQGEEIITCLYKLWKNTYGYDIPKNPLKSVYNIDTSKSLRSRNVKTRTHYGLTHKKYLKYLEPLDNQVVKSPIIKPPIIPFVEFLYKKEFSWGNGEEEECRYCGDLKCIEDGSCGECFQDIHNPTEWLEWVSRTNDLGECYEEYYLEEAKLEYEEYKLEYDKDEEPSIENTILGKMLDDGTAVCYDIEKCYSSLLLNPMDSWITMNLNSMIEPYNEEQPNNLETGLYFVETNDLSLLHQSNWYSNKILDYAKQQKIKFRIIYQLINADDKKIVKIKGEDIDNIQYFKKITDAILGINLEDKKIEKNAKKMLMNSITGLLGKTSNKVKKVGLHNNEQGIWDRVMKHIEQFGDNPTELYVEKLTYKDKNLWLYGSEYKKELYEDNLPMYIQILDWSNILLHKLQKKIGGTCIYRKTDCVVMVGGKKLELEEPTSETSNWGKPRMEDLKKTKSFNYSYLMRTDRNVEYPNQSRWGVELGINDSSNADKILEYIISNGGGLIEGRAGTGKTFVIKEGIRLGLLQDDPNYRWSFTNKASRNIGGITIHRALGLGDSEDAPISYGLLQKYKKGENRWAVIDEIGMIGDKLWSKIQFVKQYCGLNFILLGDVRQLPPIDCKTNEYEDKPKEIHYEVADEITYFNHPTILYLSNYMKCELSVMKRYDEALWNYAEEVSLETKKGVEQDLIIDNVEKLLDCRNICKYNATREKVNNTCMEYKIRTTPFRYLPYNGENKYSRNMFLYVGLPLMSVKNKEELNICNSDEFVVKSVEEDSIVVERLTPIQATEEDEEPINELTFRDRDIHPQFVVNYCSTTHKSQGLTIEGRIIVWDSIEMTSKMLYTAITRGKKLENIFNPVVEIDMKDKKWKLEIKYPKDEEGMEQEEYEVKPSRKEPIKYNGRNLYY